MTTEEPQYSYLANGTYVRDIFGGYIELPRPCDHVYDSYCPACGIDSPEEADE